MSRVLRILEPTMLVTVLFTLFGCAYFQVEQTALLTFLVVIVALIPFFLRFERQRPKPRDIMPIVVLAAIGGAGRIIFAPFPNFKPVSAIVIMSAICFGRQSGFMVGALAALTSNIFFGQGPWTPWQMYAWGMVGYMAGVLHDHGCFKRSLFIYLYGFLAALCYGFILDSWYIVGFVHPLTWGNVLAGYAAGIPSSLTHAVATVTFLIIIFKPWSRKLERIKRKFDISLEKRPE